MKNKETLDQKLEKIVSKEPSKFWEESDERVKERETLSEASENYSHNYFDMHETNNYKALKQGFIAGAKWQQDKNKYSEEEVIKIVEKSRETGLTAEFLLLTEQLKNK